MSNLHASELPRTRHENAATLDVARKCEPYAAAVRLIDKQAPIGAVIMVCEKCGAVVALGEDEARGVLLACDFEQQAQTVRDMRAFGRRVVFLFDDGSIAVAMMGAHVWGES